MAESAWNEQEVLGEQNFDEDILLPLLKDILIENSEKIGMQRATKQELLDMINEVEAEIRIVKDRISNSVNDYFYDERKDNKELSELQNEHYQLECQISQKEVA